MRDLVAVQESSVAAPFRWAANRRKNPLAAPIPACAAGFGVTPRRELAEAVMWWDGCYERAVLRGADTVLSRA